MSHMLARDVFVWRVMIDKVPTDDKLIEMSGQLPYNVQFLL